MSTLPPRPRATGAPVMLVVLVVVAAVILLGVSVTSALPNALSALGEPQGTGSTGPFGATLGALARIVMFTATALVLRWRAGLAGTETATWRWLGRAAALAAGASVLAAGLAGLEALGAPVSTAAGSAVFNFGVLAACPLLYQGLIQWNRHGSLTSEPGDWLNGLGAVFTLAAIGNFALVWLQSPLLDWPSWQAQLWLFRVAAELMLVGTAVTVLFIGDLLRDARAWSMASAVTLAAGLDAANIGDVAAATGETPYSDLGYAILAVALSISALVRTPLVVPRPSTSEAPTAGSFIVLLVSLSVLVGAG